MNDYSLIVEDVESGKIVGTISSLADKLGINQTECLARFFQLNRLGYINFQTRHNKLLIGSLPILKRCNNFIHIYFPYCHLSTGPSFNQRVIKVLITRYLLQPAYLGLIIFLFGIVAHLEPNFLSLLLTTLFVSVILIHELGHYIVATSLHVPTVFVIHGINLSVLYKTNDPQNNLYISLAGSAANLLIILLATVIHSSTGGVLGEYIFTSTILVHAASSLAVLPFFQDGKNIITTVNKLAITRK